MLNLIVLQGRLTKAPELRKTQNDIAVCTFTLAVDRDRDRGKADFVKCVAWRSTAEFMTKYFGKGQMAIVTGSLQSRDWTDKEGNKRTDWEVQVDLVNFAGEKKTADVSAAEFEEIDDGDDLPF